MTSEQKDAERYRFLRDQFALRSADDEAEFARLAAMSGEAFDQVIDAAMKETAGTTPQDATREI